MAAPTPEQMRKFFDKFFEMVGNGRIHTWDMDGLITEMESSITRAFESDTTSHVLLMTLPPEQLRLLMMPISELGWAGRRTPNALRKALIERIWQLTVRTEPELIHIKGIGRTMLNDIRSKLRVHGLSLGMKFFKVPPTP